MVAGLLEYESQNAWKSIAITSLAIVPLLILLCCCMHRVYLKTREAGQPFRWDYTSTPALRRRSSIVALSNANLTDDDHLEKEKRALAPAQAPALAPSPPAETQLVAYGRGRLQPPLLPHPTAAVAGPASTSSDTGDTASSNLAAAAAALAEPPHSAGKRGRRKYDRVYRTNEPLPGKPLIEFEDKVWDLEDEYARLDRAAASAASRYADSRTPPPPRSRPQ